MADAPDEPGGLPPLPESDDPWVILGVEPGADERAVKRAYARRIKMYRPDRSPDAFARIQAAFEHARMLGPSSPPSEPEAPAAEAPPPAAQPLPERAAARRSAMTRFSDAVAAGDHAAAHEAWKGLLAVGGSAEGLILSAPEAEQRWILTRAPITWRELSMWRHPGEAFAVWATAFTARLDAGPGLTAAIEMAGEQALVDDAAHDPTAAILFLKAVSSLAWRDAEEARVLSHRVRAPVEHPIVDLLVERARLDAHVAGTEYAACGRPPLPPELMELLADAPFMPNDAYAALEARIRTSLQERPRDVLGQLSAALAKKAAFGEALAHRLLDTVPPHRRSLDELTPPLREQLHGQMAAASRWTWWALMTALVMAAVAGAWLLGKWLTPWLEELTLANDDIEVGIGLGMILFGTAAWWCVDGALYRWVIRVRLAGVLARVGVTRAVAREWLRGSWTRFRLARFGPWMERDHALRIVGMMAATVGDENQAAEDDGR